MKMSQKPEKHWKKQGLSAVRDIELHMRTMGEMSVHKLFTQMVKESQNYLLTFETEVLYYNQTKVKDSQSQKTETRKEMSPWGFQI